MQLLVQNKASKMNSATVILNRVLSQLQQWHKGSLCIHKLRGTCQPWHIFVRISLSTVFSDVMPC